MHDGSAITFDEDGWELDVIPYTHQNVYIVRNEPMNSINIMCGSEEPPENAVKLAEITNSGEIYDRRQYAKLKVASTQEGGLKTFYDEYYRSELDEPKVKDVGTGNFSYVIIWYGYYGLDESDRLNLDCSGRCILPIDDDTPVSFRMLDFVGRTRFTFNVTKSGSILESSINPTSRTLDYGICYGVV